MKLYGYGAFILHHDVDDDDVLERRLRVDDNTCTEVVVVDVVFTVGFAVDSDADDGGGMGNKTFRTLLLRLLGDDMVVVVVSV